jgi:hypothetical protein
MAFLNMALKYHNAASKLLDIVAQGPKVGNQVPLSDPIYFLYFHTVELGLKAFLRFHGQDVPRGPAGHDIVDLYRQCETFARLDSRPYDLQNVVNLLASGNEDHGFRYFNLDSGAIPDLFWTREVVNSLIQVLREQIDDNAPPGVAVKIQMVMGKPSDQGS